MKARSGFDGPPPTGSAGYAPRKGGLGISPQGRAEKYEGSGRRIFWGVDAGTGPVNFVTRTPGVRPGRFALERLIEHAGETGHHDFLRPGAFERTDTGVR